MRSIAVTFTLAMTTLALAVLAAPANAATVGLNYTNTATEGGGFSLTSFQPFYRHYFQEKPYDDKMPVLEGDFLTRAMYLEAGLDNRTINGGSGFHESAIGLNLDFIGFHESGFGGRVNFHTDDDFDGTDVGGIGFGVHYYLGADMRVGINMDTLSFGDTDIDTTAVNFHWVQAQWSLDANLLQEKIGSADTESGIGLTFIYFLNPGLGFGLEFETVDERTDTSLVATYAMDKMRFDLKLGSTDNDGTNGSVIALHAQMGL